MAASTPHNSYPTLFVINIWVNNQNYSEKSEENICRLHDNSVNLVHAKAIITRQCRYLSQIKFAA